MQCNVITAGDSPHILESIVKLRSRLLDVIEPDFKLLDELLSLTDADIVLETGALAACLLTRGLTRRIDGENKPTGNVVISFPATLPSTVYIGYLRYIPQPMRCQKCLAYGHISAKCRRDVKLGRCGQRHSWENCPVKDDMTQVVCINCKSESEDGNSGRVNDIQLTV